MKNNFKSLLAFMLIFAVLFSNTYTITAFASKEEKKEIKLERGYIRGYSDGSLRPENNMTREEAAKVLASFMEDDQKEKELSFSDLSDKRWSYKSIKKLASKGVVEGYTDKTFKPTKDITRAEAVVMLVNYLASDDKSDKLDPRIKKHWAREELSIALSKAWIRGYEDGSIRPDKKVTRAEFVKMVNESFGIKDDLDLTSLDIELAKDLKADKWYYKDFLRAMFKEAKDSEEKPEEPKDPEEKPEEPKDPEEYIEIEDEKLRRVLNYWIDKDRPEDSKISKKEMESLKKVDVDDSSKNDDPKASKAIIPIENDYEIGKDKLKVRFTRGIKSLKGLEYAVNLEYLDLSENDIEDISPVKNLKKLKHLEFDRCMISDVSPLSDLTNLEHLNLYSNVIEDISPLSKLVNLTFLDIHFNRGWDGKGGTNSIEAVKNMKKLIKLDICNNAIEDISPVKDLDNLKILDFNDNKVRDFTDAMGVIDRINENVEKYGLGEYSVAYHGQKIDIDKEYNISSEGELIKVPNPFIMPGGFFMSHVEGIESDMDEDGNILVNIPKNTGTSDRDLTISVDLMEMATGMSNAVKGIRIKQAKRSEDTEVITDEKIVKMYRKLLNEKNDSEEFVNLTEEGKKAYREKEDDTAVTIKELSYLKIYKQEEGSLTDQIMEGLNYASNLEEFKVNLRDKDGKREIENLKALSNSKKLKLIEMTLLNAKDDFDSIEGIEGALDLKELTITNGKLANLFPLKELDIEKVILKNNNLGNLYDPLLDMTSLKYLDLSDNKRISLISGIKKLENLEVLDISAIKKADIKTIDGMDSLKDLYVNNVEDLSFEGVSNLKLRKLDARNTNLSEESLKILKSMESLEEFLY